MSTALDVPSTTDKSLRVVLDSLAPKQQLYVSARVQGSMPVVAARLAGYVNPDEAAAELEQDAIVRTAIEYMIRADAHSRKVTRQDVVNGIKDAINIAGTAGEQIAGWREIARIEGHYAPTKVQVGGEVKHIQEQVAGMTDAELAKAAAEDVEFVELIKPGG